MLRIKIKADISTDAWDSYRISKKPDHLSDLLTGEISDLLKLNKKQKEKLKVSGLVQVSVEILD